MDILYWICEYGKVLFGYLFLMFLWPSVVFCGHLRKKSRVYRFGFCVTVPVLIINTVVLMLGLFHILNSWIVRLIFGGIFLAAVVKNIVRYVVQKNKEDSVKYPRVCDLSKKYNLVVAVFAFGILYISRTKKAIIYFFPGHSKKTNEDNDKKNIAGGKFCFKYNIVQIIKNYGLLIIIILYGVLYFSYGAFQVYSYGFGDLYVHHAWIYRLTEGEIFASGVYPEAMHCFIYCMNTLFGIRIYSILLFMQGIHIVVFFVSAYLLLRQVFHWKYIPLFVLALFLTMDLNNADLIRNMFRLQITLPMEFGLYTVFLGALYLTKYLNQEHEIADEKKKTKYCWNENLFLFMITIAVSFATHFHVVIMIVIVCISFAIPVLKKVLSPKYLFPLIAAASTACLISVMPMAGALMQGIPFNYSIRWAVNTMNVNESKELNDQEAKNSNAAALRTKKDGESTIVFVRRLLFNIYKRGYAELYGTKRARWIVFLTIIISGICLFVGKEPGLQGIGKICEGYPPAILTSVIYILVYAAPIMGLPDLIPEGRFFAIGHMMILAIIAMTADIFFSALAIICTETVMQIASFLTVAGIYGSALAFGSIHGYLFYELTRYNAAVTVTNSIINTYPQYNYTIVSPTDELYQVIEYGWHEELLSFVELSSSMGFTIPSKYVFIYVEKKPILYAQDYFFTGPAWLGEEKYLEPLSYFGNKVSQSPEIIASQISEEAADQDMPEYDNSWTIYTQLENRTILESKAYAWCERFAEKYPDTLKVYYEDDEFVCLYFEQDLNGTLYDLGIK